MSTDIKQTSTDKTLCYKYFNLDRGAHKLSSPGGRNLNLLTGHGAKNKHQKQTPTLTLTETVTLLAVLGL